jgi:hypothetical protein
MHHGDVHQPRDVPIGAAQGKIRYREFGPQFGIPRLSITECHITKKRSATLLTTCQLIAAAPLFAITPHLGSAGAHEVHKHFSAGEPGNAKSYRAQ